MTEHVSEIFASEGKTEAKSWGHKLIKLTHSLQRLHNKRNNNALSFAMSSSISSKVGKEITPCYHISGNAPNSVPNKINPEN